MGWNARAATLELMIFAIVCAGCTTSGAESAGLSGNARPTAALSAMPRTLTWKKPSGKGKARPNPKPKPKPTSTIAATHKPDESAEQLLTSAVAPLVDHDDDHVAIAVDDLSNGQFASYDGTQEFITASIVKADILATLLYQLQQENGHLNPHQETLAITMIENSDNDAATKLYDEDGESSGIDAANQAFGLTETTVGTDGYWGLTTTTPDDQIRLLRQIFTSQTILAPASQAYIQGLMSQVESDQAWGVPSAADDGTSFAVKNGWLPDPTTHLWEVNSIGEVTHDGQRMLIAVLSTDDDDYADGISLIQGVIGKAADAVAGYQKL
jgi:Beta-lactamase enzyme family